MSSFLLLNMDDEYCKFPHKCIAQIKMYFFSFSLSLKCFQISLLIFYLAHSLFRSFLYNFHIFEGFQRYFYHYFLIELHCFRRTYFVGLESFLTLLRLISWTRKGLHITCITWKECVFCCSTNANQIKLVNCVFQIFEHSLNFVFLFHQLLRKEYWNTPSVHFFISFCFIYFDTLLLGSIIKIFMSSQKLTFFYYIVIFLSQLIFCCSDI